MRESDRAADDGDDYGPLTERQADNLADLAARRAEKKLYEALGRSVVRKVLFVLGAGGATFLAWVTDLLHFGPRP